METEKISLKNVSVYSDEEISQIRDFLCMLAELDYKILLKTQKKESERPEIKL